MLISFVTITVALLIALLITVLHLPRWLQRIVLWVPAWIQAGVIHFGYGGWIGGVTGHVVGGLLAIPWFFVCRFWLKPMLLRGRGQVTTPYLSPENYRVVDGQN